MSPSVPWEERSSPFLAFSFVCTTVVSICWLSIFFLFVLVHTSCRITFSRNVAVFQTCVTVQYYSAMDSDFCASRRDRTVQQKNDKKEKTGSVRDVLKTLRVTTYDLGPGCRCKRSHCFTSIYEPERR